MKVIQEGDSEISSATMKQPRITFGALDNSKEDSA